MTLPADHAGLDGLATGMPAGASDEAGTGDEPLTRRVLHDPSVRALVVSRFCTALGVATLAYGGMVYLATTGSSQVMISLIGAVRFLAALIFGLAGGILVGRMSNRGALVSAYGLEAAACFIVPTLWGTSVGSLVVLVFIVATLSQISTPAIKSATAEVSLPAQVATVAAILTVAAGIGSAMGTAILAPVLINVSTITAIIYVSGVALAISAVRVLRLPADENATSLLAAVQAVDWTKSFPSRRRTADWLLANRRFATMILINAMAIALFEGVNSLMPVFVRDVLGTNPVNAVYILAPGGIGFLVGSMLGPWLMDHRGERALGIFALGILGLGVVLFGLIDQVAPILAPISPLRLLELAGIQLSPQMQAAGVISILTAFGSTAVLTAVQTYINRYVVLTRQAEMFGMEEVIDNAIVLVTLLAVGGIATAIGPRLVFLVAPPLLVIFVVWLIRASFRLITGETPSLGTIAHALFDPTPWEQRRDQASPVSGDAG